jgi:hypothetical protein
MEMAQLQLARNRRTLESGHTIPGGCEGSWSWHALCRLPMSAGRARDAATKGNRGPAVGDAAPENVSTTRRHAQRSDIMDTLRPLQSIGVIYV